MAIKAIIIFFAIPIGIALWMPLEARAERHIDILEEFRWNNRLLFVFTPSRSNRKFLEQKTMIKRNRAGFEDRDVVVLRITGERVFAVNHSSESPFNASSLRSKFGVDERQFLTILIGKDGTIKYKNLLPLDPCHLFSLIDSMPMRRLEISDGGGINACVK